MSQTVDTNVLVHATHTGSPFHGRARALVEHLVGGPSLAYPLWPAVVGYLRIVTHPAILQTPLSSEEAMSNVGSVLGRPHVRVVGEGDDFWETFGRIARDVKPRGTLLPDTHLVAFMQQHGVSTIWSHDPDFRKFRGITVKDPFSDRYSTGFE